MAKLESHEMYSAFAVELAHVFLPETCPLACQAKEIGGVEEKLDVIREDGEEERPVRCV